jgi:hypothetical protein
VETERQFEFSFISRVLREGRRLYGQTVWSCRSMQRRPDMRRRRFMNGCGRGLIDSSKK